MDILVIWRQYKRENSAPKFDFIRSNVSNRQLCAQILARRGDVWPHFYAHSVRLNLLSFWTRKISKSSSLCGRYSSQKKLSKTDYSGLPWVNPCGRICSEFAVFFMHFLDELFLLSVISQITWSFRYEKVQLSTRSLLKKKRNIFLLSRENRLSKWLFLLSQQGARTG